MCVLCSIAKVRVDTSRTRLYSCVIYFFYLEIIFPSCVHRQCVCAQKEWSLVCDLFTQKFFGDIYIHKHLDARFVCSDVLCGANEIFCSVLCVKNLAFFAKKKRKSEGCIIARIRKGIGVYYQCFIPPLAQCSVVCAAVLFISSTTTNGQQQSLNQSASQTNTTSRILFILWTEFT